MQFQSQMQNAEQSIQSKATLDIENYWLRVKCDKYIHQGQHLEFTTLKMGSVSSSRKILDF